MLYRRNIEVMSHICLTRVHRTQKFKSAYRRNRRIFRGKGLSKQKCKNSKIPKFRTFSSCNPVRHLWNVLFQKTFESKFINFFPMFSAWRMVTNIYLYNCGWCFYLKKCDAPEWLKRLRVDMLYYPNCSSVTLKANWLIELAAMYWLMAAILTAISVMVGQCSYLENWGPVGWRQAAQQGPPVYIYINIFTPKLLRIWVRPNGGVI